MRRHDRRIARIGDRQHVHRPITRRLRRERHVDVEQVVPRQVGGVVEGAGERMCELKFITRETPLKVGDVAITSGMDRVFPKGLVVGTVSEVNVQSGGLFQTVEVKPAVDFSRLEEVLVVLSSAEIAPPPPSKKGA